MSVTQANRNVSEKGLAKPVTGSKPSKAKLAVKNDQLRAYWKHHARSLAFLYVASLLPWSPPKLKQAPSSVPTAPASLLDALIASPVKFDQVKKLLHDWAN